MANNSKPVVIIDGVSNRNINLIQQPNTLNSGDPIVSIQGYSGTGGVSRTEFEAKISEISDSITELSDAVSDISESITSINNSETLIIGRLSALEQLGLYVDEDGDICQEEGD